MTFKAKARWSNPTDAEICAKEHGMSFGLCVFDGKFYVGYKAELDKGGIVSPDTRYEFKPNNCSGVNNGCICGTCTAQADTAVKTWLNGGEFALTNDPPAPPKGPPIFGITGQQKVLFAALDAEPATRFLFDNDVGPE